MAFKNEKWLRERGAGDHAIAGSIEVMLLFPWIRTNLGVARILKEGGELYFSDVYCDRRLSKQVQSHEVLWGECIAGKNMLTSKVILY